MIGRRFIDGWEEVVFFEVGWGCGLGVEFVGSCYICQSGTVQVCWQMIVVWLVGCLVFGLEGLFFLGVYVQVQNEMVCLIIY